MPQVLDYYGIERNRANRIRCVLHNGTDFNCGIKDHYIHCFVCGQSADVIKFVQVYFGLDFQSAISKLNDDFCLRLPIGQKIDRRKQLEMGRIAFERKRKEEQQQKERQQIEDDYWAAFEELFCGMQFSRVEYMCPFLLCWLCVLKRMYSFVSPNLTTLPTNLIRCYQRFYRFF